MNQLETVFGLAALTGAISMWLLLPGTLIIGRWGRWLGVVLGLVSLALLASRAPGLGDWISDSVFYILAGVTIIASAGTVTLRNPVYCAIWFAMSLLGTAGLFLFQGAQFLGVATVVVYAGAILVTFLFVLMLASPEGHAAYDRISWEGLLSAATGALMVGVLTLTLAVVFQNPSVETRPVAQFTKEQLDKQILAPQHMAHLGGELFSRHLVAIEVAGTLLLVALVGTVAIVSQIKTQPAGMIRPENREARHG